MNGRDEQIGALTRLPAELRALDRFLVFSRRPRSGGHRVGKVPMQVLGGRMYATSAANPAAWLEFEAALDYLRAGLGDGLGLALGPDLGLVAVDLDGVITDGRIDPAAQTLIRRLDGYCEASVSGSGLHVLVRGVLPGPRRRGAGVEFIDRGYLTVTGHAWPSGQTTVPERQMQLTGLYHELFPPSPPVASGHVPSRSDDEVVAALLTARNGDRVRRLLVYGETSNGYSSPSEKDFAAVRMIGFFTDDPDQVIRILLNSALHRPERWQQGNYLIRTVERALALGYPTRHSHRPAQVAPFIPEFP
jgi:primase-polymerase (primpol)-like protein